MTTRSRAMFRILVVCLTAAGLLAAHAGYQWTEFTRHLRGLETTALEDYLREAFPASLFGDSSGNAEDRVRIRERASAFNTSHWTLPEELDNGLRLAITKAGTVEIPAPTDVKTSLLSLSLDYGIKATDFQLVTPQQRLITPLGWSVLAVFIAAGFALSFTLPHPAPFNSFPLARDLSIVFDRKVSSGHQWGAYRLTHLGGGGELPGLANNNFSACNDIAIRRMCFRGVKNAFDRFRLGMAQSLPADVRSVFTEAMDIGFCTAVDRLDKQTPEIRFPDAVSRLFRPFVRDNVLGFTLLSFENTERLAKLTGLPEDCVAIQPAPSWLIGGYEIYYPGMLFGKLIEEVRSGQLSVVGQAFDHLEISADAISPYISVDLVVSNQSLNAADINRIRQYLSRPFAGGLHRTAALLQGFGRLLIFDQAVGFDVTFGRPSSTRHSSALVTRLDFRRIRPEELIAVRALAKRRGVTA